MSLLYGKILAFSCQKIIMKKKTTMQFKSSFKSCEKHNPTFLLNLLNSLPKSDKMLGKPCILSLFLNLFDKFNNT